MESTTTHTNGGGWFTVWGCAEGEEMGLGVGFAQKGGDLSWVWGAGIVKGGVCGSRQIEAMAAAAPASG